MDDTRRRKCTPWQAVIDSGASDNVVGVNTLQELAEIIGDLGFDVEKEFEVDRNIHKNFIYGGDHSSKALGLAHLNLGILVKEVKVSVHVVEGNTPLLLSAKFLYDARTTINFRSGVAAFMEIHDEAVQLERGPGNHLLLPVTLFGGRSHLLEPLHREPPEEPELRALRPNPTCEPQGDEPVNC